MIPTVTPPGESSGKQAALYIGLELSAREWRLACSRALDGPTFQAAIPAGDREALQRVIAQMKARCGVGAAAAMSSCYEAGRDGFWPHRFVESEGVQNIVVDSSSIEVNRRARRAKTDRLDARKLLRLLLRWSLGERDVWHRVAVPTPAAEAARHASRELTMLIRERTRWRNRIHSLLATVGARMRIDGRLAERLPQLRTWEGQPLPVALQERVLTAWRLLEVIEAERTVARQAQHARTRQAATPAAATAAQLVRLRGIGERFAWALATEVCSRDLRNRREVGALTGFTGVPYQSGNTRREQGISRTGLAQLRALAVETAWVWVQWQPNSAVTKWFEQRVAHAGPVGRQISIVAVARRLVIALWRYTQTGTLPTGAVVKTGVA